MKSVPRTIPLGFSDQRVPEGHHICYIYNDDDERLDVITRFLKSGLEVRERILYMVDVMTSEEMRAYLNRNSAIFTNATPNDLIVSDATPSYCPNGYFNTDQMLDIIKNFYNQSMEEGYAGVRGTGEMSWCLRGGHAKSELMLYEARLTGLLETYPCTAC